jgi:hypothetical protein
MRNSQTITVVSLFLFLLSSSLYSQSVCEKLNVVNVSPDTSQSGEYVVSISYKAGSNELLSYPRVINVIDCKGDTIATGGMFYFGQLGATTQAYPIKLTTKDSMGCYPLTATFVANNTSGGSDTCKLVFGTTGVEDDSNDKTKPPHTLSIALYPNPATDELVIATPDYRTTQQFPIVDACGRICFEGTITSAQTRIDTRFLAPGVYAIVLNNTSTKMFVVGMR